MIILISYISVFVQIVAWFPYDTKNCFGRNLEITKLGHCRNGRLDPPTVDVFPNKVYTVAKHFFFFLLINCQHSNKILIISAKIPNNWERCPLIVSTNIWPPFVIDSRTSTGRQLPHTHNAITKLTEGVEIEIIKALADSFNFQASFM